LTDFFESDHLAWVEAPSGDVASHNRVMADIILDSLATSYGLQDATWTRADNHPLFTAIFRFRFCVTSSSRRTGETRETWYFYCVKGARERTMQLYANVLRHSSDAFIRQPVIHHDPILTLEQLQLLEDFEWENPNYEQRDKQEAPNLHNMPYLCLFAAAVNPVNHTSLGP
jgi:hypothetical protein